MNKEEIKDFLRQKSGYLKEGGKRLHKLLAKKGFKTEIYICKNAIREVKQELVQYPFLYEKSLKKDEPKILFFDIEVSYGLARVWKPGYNLRVSYEDFKTHPKIICISYKWNNSNEVYSLQWNSKQNDENLLREFIPILNEADFIVAHNCDKFDLPWIRTRSLYHNLDILPTYTSVDTLKIAKHKYRFPSNRLDDLGDYLGIGRKISTNRDLWVDVVCEGIPEALDTMVEYCENDVVLLENVYKELTKQTIQRVHFGVLNNKEIESSPYTGSKNYELVKTRTTSMGSKRRVMRCLDTNKYFEMSDSTYKKYMKDKNS